eukprot:gene25092-30306_t
MVLSGVIFRTKYLFNLFNEFVDLYMKHFTQSNERILPFLSGIGVYEVLRIIAYGIATFSLIIVASKILSTSYQLRMHGKSSLVLSAFLGLIMISFLGLPCLLPYKALVLGGGLMNFSFVLYIFGRLMEIMRQDSQRSTMSDSNAVVVSSPADTATADSSHPKQKSHQLAYHKGEAMYCVFAMISYYLYPHLIPNEHKHSGHRTYQPPPRIWTLSLDLLWLLVVFDTMLFVIQEVLPQVYPATSAAGSVAYFPSFHPSSVSTLHFYTSMWSAAFDMICMHIIYLLAQLACVGLYGYHIPAHMMHTTPALSHSVSEFWKVRWNPCTSKLLQYALYKPIVSYLHIHHAYMPKAYMQLLTVCVVFLGSGLLHAYPIYLATRSEYDTLCIGGYFLIQMMFVVAENMVSKVLFDRHQPLSSSPSAPASSTSSAMLVKSKAAEYLVIASVLCVIHIVYDGLFAPIPLSILIVVVTANLCVMYSQFYQYVKHSSQSIRLMSPPSSPPASSTQPKARVVIFYLFGWLYTIGALTYWIPLFSMPMHNALGHVYERSH